MFFIQGHVDSIHYHKMCSRDKIISTFDNENACFHGVINLNETWMITFIKFFSFHFDTEGSLWSGALKIN